ncbi:hypothetical protein BdWA1_002608 [Babesia duncani]|uniref:Uncharacterized protein n=1 Tax=Babesia duncani TaxID=323732 RepID=A0AAD9PJH5_9APIC|nr:hypothetical protein BdWA1_002608 [Babesia duncani]
MQPIIKNLLLGDLQYSIGRRFVSTRGRSRIRQNQLTSKRQEELEQKIKELQMLQYQQPQQKQGFMSIIKEGALHGIGWAFAQRLVDSIFGPRSIQFFNPPNNNDSVTSGEFWIILLNVGNDNIPPLDNDNDSGWGWNLDEFLSDE